MPEPEMTIDIIPNRKVQIVAPKHEPLQLRISNQAKKTFDESKPLTFREMIKTME